MWSIQNLWQAKVFNYTSYINVQLDPFASKLHMLQNLDHTWILWLRVFPTWNTSPDLGWADRVMYDIIEKWYMDSR